MASESLLQRPGPVRAATLGLWVGGGVLLGVLTAFDYPLVGVGLYAVAVLVSVGLGRNYEGVLFDERDRRNDQVAAARTLQVFGLASAGVFPTLTALWGLGYFQWQEWSVTLALAVAVLYVTYGAIRFAVEGRG
jgi:uncharacterized membrane protein